LQPTEHAAANVRFDFGRAQTIFVFFFGRLPLRTDDVGITTQRCPGAARKNRPAALGRGGRATPEARRAVTATRPAARLHLFA